MVSIGDTGRFSVDVISLPDVIYTVEATSTINSMIALGVDVFEFIYAPLGITQETFNTVNGSDVILTLRNEMGESLLIPKYYITSIDETGTVPYREYAVVIKIGAWPNNTSFSELKNELEVRTEALLGLKPRVITKPISRMRYLPESEDAYIRFLKDSRKVSFIDPEVNIRRANEMADEAIRKYGNMVRFVERYLRHCKRDCTEIDVPLPRNICTGILSKTFDIECPCGYDFQYETRPELPAQPPPVHVPPCGSLTDTLFKPCGGFCISVNTALIGCQEQMIRPEPETGKLQPRISMAVVNFDFNLTHQVTSCFGSQWLELCKKQ
jgi:hypothetical protein